MADDVTITSGANSTPPDGTVIATDDVGGVHYQRLKIDLGGDGAASPLVRGQQADANSIPVTLSSEQAAFIDGLETLLAAIETATEAIQAAVEATLTVSGSVTANAGTNLNTSALATHAKQDTIIGHVDGIETLLGTIDTDTSRLEAIETATEATQAALETAGGLVVNLGANNDVTVTGTVDLGAVDNAVLDAIAASLALIDNAIATGNELQVDVVAALPAGTNAIGKLAANSGVDIGDVDVTSMATGDFEHYGNLDVDQTAEQLTAFACKFGVQIKADDDNSSSVYVGKSDVSTGTDATAGFRLKAGQGVFIPVSNANLIYVIGGADNQKVWVLAA